MISSYTNIHNYVTVHLNLYCTTSILINNKPNLTIKYCLIIYTLLALQLCIKKYPLRTISYLIHSSKIKWSLCTPNYQYIPVCLNLYCTDSISINTNLHHIVQYCNIIYVFLAIQLYINQASFKSI